MTIDLSETAAKEIKRLQTSRRKPNSRFRLAVKSGGCSGWFYTLELEEEQATKAGERTYETQGISVVIDEQSYASVRGLKLDYSEDLMGGGFRFHNPNATTTCSCGLSFSLESSSGSWPCFEFKIPSSK